MPTDVSVELVPDPSDARLRIPMVEVEAGGVPLRVVLDTGACRSRVTGTPEFATALAASTGTASSRSVLGSAEERHITVPVVFAGHDLGEVEIGATPDGSGLDGLLGLDILGRFRCEYRLAEGRLVLDSTAPATSPVRRAAGGHVLLDLGWPDGATGAFVFDTGASITVVDIAFAAAHPGLFRADGSSTGTDASGASAETPLAIMTGPTILGRAFADSLAALVDLATLGDAPIAGILGWPLISAATWVIDHPALRAAVR